MSCTLPFYHPRFDGLASSPESFWSSRVLLSSPASSVAKTSAGLLLAFFFFSLSLVIGLSLQSVLLVYYLNMPSMLKSVGVAVAGLAAMSSALPAQPKFTRSQMKIHEFMKRQSAAETAAGLTDIEILQL